MKFLKYLSDLARRPAKDAADHAAPTRANQKPGTNNRSRPTPPRAHGEERTTETSLMSERVPIERKLFSFELKENASGRFLRITEDVAGRRDTIIVPATGLAAFRDAIENAMRTGDG